MIKKFEDLKGLTLQSVEVLDHETEMVLTTTEGIKVRLYHSQDCCESVYIESIVGDLGDLIGSPLTLAEEVVGESQWDDNGYDSVTWTFYKLATVKGYVDIRWCGASNGYYSESVDMAVSYTKKEEE